MRYGGLVDGLRIRVTPTANRKYDGTWQATARGLEWWDGEYRSRREAVAQATAKLIEWGFSPTTSTYTPDILTARFDGRKGRLVAEKAVAP